MRYGKRQTKTETSLSSTSKITGSAPKLKIKIKKNNDYIQIFDFHFSVCRDSKIFNKFHFLIPHNFNSHDEIRVNEKIN